MAAVLPGEYQLSVTADSHQPHRARVRVGGPHDRISAGAIQLDAAPQPPLPTAGWWDIDPAHTSIRCIAWHIGLADVHGRFNSFRGAPKVAECVQDSRLEVVIDAARIDTGMCIPALPRLPRRRRVPAPDLHQ